VRLALTAPAATLMGWLIQKGIERRADWIMIRPVWKVYLENEATNKGVRVSE